MSKACLTLVTVYNRQVNPEDHENSGWSSLIERRAVGLGFLRLLCASLQLTAQAMDMARRAILRAQSMPDRKW